LHRKWNEPCDTVHFTPKGAKKDLVKKRGTSLGRRRKRVWTSAEERQVNEERKKSARKTC
jgi:hypothetical protein